MSKSIKKQIKRYKSAQIIDKQLLIREERRVYELRTEGKLGRKNKRYKLIDAFAGAGGMTLGFSELFGHSFEICLGK